MPQIYEVCCQAMLTLRIVADSEEDAVTECCTQFTEMVLNAEDYEVESMLIMDEAHLTPEDLDKADVNLCEEG